MAKRKPLTNKAGEVRELTAEDFKHALRFSELPQEMQAALGEVRKRGRPRKANRKQEIKLRVAPDVLAAFRATGKGWQTRMHAVLAEWVQTHRH